MALAVTARHSAGPTQSATQTQTTDSQTPSAESLLLVFWVSQRQGHTTSETPQDPVGGGWTYTQRHESDDFAWDGTYSFASSGFCYSAPVGAAPSAHTITVDSWSTTDVAAYSTVCADITGYDADTPIAQAVSDGSSVSTGDGHSGTVTLGSTPTVGNVVVVLFSSGADSGGGFAAPTLGGQSMTPLFNQDGSWQQSGLWYRVVTGAESSDTITCSDVGDDVGNWLAIAVEILAAAGGGATVNGTAEVSLGALTLTAAGKRVVHGSASVTLGGLSLSATSRRTVHGSADVALGALTLTGAGSRVVHGTASVALGGLAVTATGRRTVHGSASVALGGIDITLTGHRIVYGTADLSLGGLDLAAVGEVVGVIHGTADVTLGGLTLAATGRRVVHGSAQLQLGGLNLTAAGQDITHGTAQVNLGALTLTATGHRVVHGSATITLGGLALTAVAAGLAVDPIVLPPFREPPVPDYMEAAVPAYRETAVPAYRESVS